MLARTAILLSWLVVLPLGLGCGPAKEKVAEDRLATQRADQPPAEAARERLASGRAANRPSDSDAVSTSGQDAVGADGTSGLLVQAPGDSPPAGASELPRQTSQDGQVAATNSGQVSAAASGPEASSEGTTSASSPASSRSRTDLGKVVESVGRVLGGGAAKGDSDEGGTEKRNALWRSLGRAFNQGVRDATLGKGSNPDAAGDQRAEPSANMPPAAPAPPEPTPSAPAAGETPPAAAVPPAAETSVRSRGGVVPV